MRSLLTFGLALAAFSTTAFASAPAPQSKAQLCKMAKTPQAFEALLEDSSNMNALENRGGLGGGGVCWWHSRLTRYMTYNAFYSPEKQRPTDEQAKEILKSIRDTKHFVEIPGYHNFSEFSMAYDGVIQKFLNKWQVDEGVFGFGFFKGTKDADDDVSAASLPERMELLYSQVHGEGRIEYQMLQTPGLSSHAWLVVGMTKNEFGYQLNVIDSNYTTPQTAQYNTGSPTMATSYGGLKTFTGSTTDLKKVSKLYEKECGHAMWKHDEQKEDKIIAKFREKLHPNDSSNSNGDDQSN